VSIASGYDFSLFEYWASDYAGHQQDMDGAVGLLETFDGVLGGLIETWDDTDGLVLITSDHGNLEDVSTRRHTLADVPALVIGSAEARADFLDGLNTLADVTPAILRSIGA
jgi:bisphosphoglycerate-independent phosphoglycerate mutase (AlkP superfamily)